MTDETGVPAADPALADLSPDTDLVSRLAFLALWSGRAPVTMEVLLQETDWHGGRLDAAIAELLHAGRLELDDRRDIVGAHGVTLRTTPHRIGRDRGDVHTWCAFDAVGIPCALGIDADVSSTCPSCGRRLKVEIRSGDPVARTPVVWVPSGPCPNIMSDFCSTANLFCSREHLDEWRLAAGKPMGAVLTIDEVGECGRRAWADVAV